MAKEATECGRQSSAHKETSVMASDKLNRTMIEVRRHDNALITTAVDARSQQSASCDDRPSLAPFSANESGFHGLGDGDEVDSAQASFADWVDILKHHVCNADAGFDLAGGVTITEQELGAEEPVQAWDLSGLQQSDSEAADELNQGFINEHSAIEIGRPLSKASRECFDVKDRFDGLEVKAFSIREMLDRDRGVLGRRTNF